MNWFKHGIKILFQKTASKQQLRDQALSDLQNGDNPSEVLNSFINGIIQENPSAAKDPSIMNMRVISDPASAFMALQNFNVSEKPTQPLLFDNNNIYDANFEGVSKDAPLDLNGGELKLDGTNEEVTDINNDDNLDVNTQDETVGEGGTPEAVQDMAQEINDPNDEDAIDLREGVGLALTKQDENALDPNKNIIIDPTVLEVFDIPSDQIMKFQAKLANYNRQLIRSANEPWTMELVKTFSKPVDINGVPTEIEFTQIKVRGVLPHTSDTGLFKKRNWKRGRNGKMVKANPFITTDERGFRAIAQIMFHPLSPEEQKKHLENGKTNPILKQHILECQKRNEIPFYNDIDPFKGAPKINERFFTSPNTECEMCKDGQHRNFAIIVCLVDKKNMVPVMEKVQDEQGQWVEKPVTAKRQVSKGVFKDEPLLTVPEEAIKSAPQVQLGGTCADIVNINLMKGLKKWVQDAKKPQIEAPDHNNDNKAPQEPWAKQQWRMSLPSDSVFAAIVHQLRDPFKRRREQRRGYKKQIGLIASKLAYYYDILKKDPSEISERILGRARQTDPQLDDYDFKVAQEVRQWWTNKLGARSLDIDTRNKINYSILGKIKIMDKGKVLTYLPEMVYEYLNENNIRLEPVQRKPITPTPYQNPFQTRPTPQPTQPIAQPTQPIAQETEEEDVTGDRLDKVNYVKNLPTGSPLTATFKYVGSKPWSNNKGLSHIFTLDDKDILDNRPRRSGRVEPVEYKIFQRNHSKNPMQFTPGKEYSLTGTKGEYKREFNSIVLGNTEDVKVSDTDTLKAQPEVKQQAPIETPQTPMETPQLTTSPSGEEQTPPVIQYAMNALIKGIDRNNKPITSESLFQKFTDFIAKLNPEAGQDDTKEDIISSLKRAHEYDKYNNETETLPLTKQTLIEIYNTYAQKK